MMPHTSRPGLSYTALRRALGALGLLACAATAQAQASQSQAVQSQAVQGQATQSLSQLNFTLIVKPACEVYAQTATTLTLRCTTNYSPLNPATVADLRGQLPTAGMTLMSSRKAPVGGTFNEYALQVTTGLGPSALATEFF